jgi:hypothetical protein
MVLIVTTEMIINEIMECEITHVTGIMVETGVRVETEIFQ